MSASDRDAVDALRAAVREAMGDRSIREAAREIGLTHTALGNFLKGSSPHAHNRRKYQRWLARQVREPRQSYAAPPGRASFELAMTLIRGLARTADPDRADRAADEAAAALRRAYRDAGRKPPAWMGEEE